MIFIHNYGGNAGRCHRCGMTRREGFGMPCELLEDLEFTEHANQIINSIEVRS